MQQYFEKLYDKFLQRPFAVIAFVSLIANGFLYSEIQTAYQIQEHTSRTCDSTKTELHREYLTMFLELQAETKDVKQETEGLIKKKSRKKLVEK